MKEKIIEKVKTMLPLLNEKQKRLYLAAEAIAYGRGGITFMSHISGVSRSVITTGVKEIKSGDPEILSANTPLRRKGAGENPLQKHSLE